jgi:predicted DNA-binding protein
MIRTQIQLSEEQYRRLKSCIRDLDISLSAAIREAVDHWLSGRDRAAVAERSLRSLGGFRSGRRDVSKRHDEHLADLYGEGAD